MFKTREEQLALNGLKRNELLSMYRAAVTKISRMNLKFLAVEPSAKFDICSFSFSITAYSASGENSTLTIYDFWSVKDSENLTKSFITAIRSDDINTVKAAPTR